MEQRFVEIRDFLTKKLKRSLTEEELQFLMWLSSYEQYTYDQIMKFFKELSSKKR